MSTEPYRIDVHHHVLPPVYVQALTRIGAAQSGGASLPPWDLAATLELMDRQQIATAIASVSAPGVYFGDAAFARDTARRCNEFIAQIVRDYPQRFGALAVLPLPDTDAALRELEYALDTLHLDGVILLASVGPQYQGDLAFDELYAELHRRNVVVLLHPTTPPGSDALQLTLPAFVVEFVFDTTRAIANLIYQGVFERYPGITWIVAHAGGTAPYLVDRFAMSEAIAPELHVRAPQGAKAYLQRLYYDTAIAASPAVFGALQTLVAADHVLFGSDHPYLTEPLVEQRLRGVATYAGFDAQARRAIERDASLRLFPRLQAILQ
jgi:predicted TIM-barrel fold metal-dependent hydrolase